MECNAENQEQDVYPSLVFKNWLIEISLDLENKINPVMAVLTQSTQSLDLGTSILEPLFNRLNKSSSFSFIGAIVLSCYEKNIHVIKPIEEYQEECSIHFNPNDCIIAGILFQILTLNENRSFIADLILILTIDSTFKSEVRYFTVERVNALLGEMLGLHKYYIREDADQDDIEKMERFFEMIDQNDESKPFDVSFFRQHRQRIKNEIQNIYPVNVIAELKNNLKNEYKNIANELQHLRVLLKKEQHSARSKQEDLNVANSEIANLKSQIEAIELPNLELTLSFLPSIFKNFWYTVRPDELANIIGLLESPKLESPYHNPTSATIQIKKKQFLELPEKNKQQIIALSQDLNKIFGLELQLDFRTLIVFNEEEAKMRSETKTEPNKTIEDIEKLIEDPFDEIVKIKD